MAAEINHHEHEPHVAVLAFPFGTHAAPLLSLTRRLAAAAPDVTFSFFGTAKSNRSISGDRNPPNIKVVDVDDGVPEGYVFKGKRHEDMELYLNAVPGNFREGLAKAVSETEKSVSCLISDAFLWYGADLADELKVSWVPFWTASASALSAHYHTDFIRDTVGVGLTGKEEEPLTFIPGMHPSLLVKDLPSEVLDGGDEASVISRLLHRMAQTLPRAATITINSFDSLDQSVINDLRSKFANCLTLGPINNNLTTSSSQLDRDPYSCLSWLQDKEPASVAYVSFGTVTTPPSKEVAALAKALEDSNAFFVWSLKEAQMVNLPEGFLERTKERGMVVPWAPQEKILGHSACGAFVTHCGWNSVLESVSGGVPMICRPFFGDQKMNRRLVSHVWGIGVGVKNGVLCRDGVKESLDLILNKEQGKEMRKKVEKLKQLSKQAVAPGGSSSNNFQTLLKMICQR